MPTIAMGLAETRLSAAQREKLALLSEGYDLLFSRDREQIRQHIADIEIVFASVPRDLFVEMPSLRWYQQWTAGADWIARYPEVKEKNFIITNASGVHPIQISEHVFGLLLAFARAFPQSYAAQQRGQWRSFSTPDVFELANKTMLIIGVGAIGERIARLAKAFDMRVLGIRRHVERPAEYIDKLYSPEDLAKVLPEADAIVLTLPLTQESRHLIGKPEFALMKDTACLINIGRGGTIDEQAMVDALQAGKLSGVGLDVFEQEPLPEDSPLWQLERLIISPHYSGLSPHYQERIIAIFLDNLERYRSGEPLKNVVDQALGY